MWRPSVVAAVLIAGTALAQDAAAPRVALDGALTPLAGPVAIGGAGWGPFRRICTTRAMLRADGSEAAAGSPECLLVTAVREARGTWHVTLQTEPRGTAAPFAYAATRDAAGRIGTVTAMPPGGMAPLSAAQRREAEERFRRMLRAIGVERMTIAPGGRFALPMPPDDTGAEGALDCRPLGEGLVGGRRVVVASCDRQGEPLGGQVAIDVATGLALRQAHAFTARAGRGVTRQGLE